MYISNEDIRFLFRCLRCTSIFWVLAKPRTRFLTEVLHKYLKNPTPLQKLSMNSDTYWSNLLVLPNSSTKFQNFPACSNATFLMNQYFLSSRKLNQNSTTQLASKDRAKVLVAERECSYPNNLLCHENICGRAMSCQEKSHWK